jgi:hypothetical protein
VPNTDRERPLLSVRAALIFVTSLFFSVMVGALMVAAGSSVPQALLAAVGTAGAAIPALNRIVGKMND